MPRAAQLRLLVALLLLPALCAAQDLTPRAYLPLPTSSNAVILTYAFVDGELLFDPTLPVTDAKATIHTPVATFYHAFNLAGRSANVTGTLPVAIGDIRGTVAGVDRDAHRAGLGDLVARLAVNAWGAPARTAFEFVKAPRIRSLLGASVKIVAPTGQYNPTRLINIGVNRWAFKPELGYMRRVGPLMIDAYAGVWLFTANNDFYRSGATAPNNTRRQDPIGALECHISYDVRPRLWISADINYWRGGRTSVNDSLQFETLQSNSRLGATASIPLTRRQSIKVSYSEGVTVRIGGDFRILSVGWQYGWLGMPSGTQ